MQFWNLFLLSRACVLHAQSISFSKYATSYVIKNTDYECSWNAFVPILLFKFFNLFSLKTTHCHSSLKAKQSFIPMLNSWLLLYILVCTVELNGSRHWIVCCYFQFVTFLYLCIMLYLYGCTACYNHNQVSDIYCISSTFRNWYLPFSSKNTFNTFHSSHLPSRHIPNAQQNNTQGWSGAPFTVCYWDHKRGRGRCWIVLQTCAANRTTQGAPTTKSIATAVPKHAGVRTRLWSTSTEIILRSEFHKKKWVTSEC